MLVGALVIHGAEVFRPFKTEWKGFDSEAGVDGLYLLLVHGGWGKLLEVGAVLTLVTLFGQRPSGLWPVAWPLWQQILAMIMLSEFVRYWIHRWHHEKPWLWRFHAVHHSVPRLYWWNVGRFHPVDKFLQLCGETLLFIVLGAGPKVLAGYFVFYAVNGFFQHCNIDMRLGWLNRLVSGPEQHRWHHSYLAVEANKNYGNKTSLYDQLFGTYYLPHSAGPTRYGLKNDHYPRSFLGQLIAPFVHGIDQRGKANLRGLLIASRISARGRKEKKRYRRAGLDVAGTQKQVLLKILEQNRHTTFAREHAFTEIRDPADFVRRVPVADYERLRPYFEKQEAEKHYDVITGRPLFYTQTSGSTDKPKLIPIMPSTLEAYQRAQNLWLNEAMLHCPDFTTGSFLGFTGQLVEGYTDGGLEIGSTSAHIFATLPKAMQKIYVVPLSVYEIADPRWRYLMIARLVLQQADISFVAMANPSTILRLEELVNQHAGEFIQDIESGGFFGKDSVGREVWQEVKPLLKADVARADVLRKIQTERGHISLLEMFPELRLLATWQGGSCRLSYEKLRAQLGSRTSFHEIGYVASEGRMSVPVAGTEGEWPTLLDHFYEFSEVEADQETWIGLAEVEVGKEYSILLTTPGGLYRYRMNDVVRVVGKHFGIPLIKFERKCAGITSITGEKLYENQFLSAASQVGQRHGVSLQVIAVADEVAGHYRLFTEGNTPATYAAEVDQELCLINNEYCDKRRSGRLGPCNLVPMRLGFVHRLGEREVAFKKIREAQWKLRALVTYRELEMVFPDWQDWQELT